MKMHTQATGIFLFVSSCQKTGDDTCQYITAACCSHTAVARTAEVNLPVRVAECRIMSL